MLIADSKLEIKYVGARSLFPKILNLRGHQYGTKSPRKTSTEEDSSHHYQNRNHDTQDRFPDSCSAQSGKIAGIHHPPDLQYCYDELLEHLTNSCDRLLTDNPSKNLIICGDPKDILTQLNLLQMVNTPTRKNKILGGFITNAPRFLRKVSVAQGLVRSDHTVVLVYHRIPLKAKRKTVMLRDVRDRHNLKMDNLLKCHNWDNIY